VIDIRERNLLTLTSLLLPTTINAIIYAYTFGFNPFPPIDDPAIRLKEAYALLGNAYPLWNQTPLQYPPLFNMALAMFVASTGDPLFSIKFLGILLISTMCLSIYPLVKHVTGSRVAGIVSVWLLAFHPIFAEMYGWGGYANILGQAFLLLALNYMLRTVDYCKNSDFILATFFSALTVLTHHLTTIVYAAVCVAFLLLVIHQYTRGRVSTKVLARTLATMFTALSAFLAWRSLAGPFQYVTFNYASLATRPFDSEAFWWMFKDQFSSAFLFVTAFIGAAALYYYGKRKELLLLLTLTCFPFLFTQAYLFGIALDFRRFPSFAVPGIISLCSSAVLPLKWENFKFNSEEKTCSFKVESALLASMLTITLLSNVLVGLNMPYKVNEYYHYLQDYAYGVEEKLEALNWLKENTSKYTVVVADSSLGRWIEGYSQRRTLLELEPYQIFIVGELERYAASNTILHANIALLNQYVRTWDDAPYYTQHTPWIAVSNGPDYKNVLYLVDGTVETKFAFAGNVWIESPYTSKVESVRYLMREGGLASVSVTYLSKSLNITKVTTLKDESDSLEITYIIKPIIEANIIETEVPVWIPYESTLKNPLFYSGKLHFTVDDVQVEMEGKGNVTVGRDERWRQQRILYTFKPSNNVVEAKLSFTFLNPKRSWWNTRLLALTSDEIINQYNVSYIALSKNKDDYTRFVEDPRMKLAYENSKLIIFSVES
jgi:hypothetical protein